MATKKIAQLPEDASPSEDAWVEIEDPVTGVSKKVAIKNLDQDTASVSCDFSDASKTYLTPNTEVTCFDVVIPPGCFPENGDASQVINLLANNGLTDSIPRSTSCRLRLGGVVAAFISDTFESWPTSNQAGSVEVKIYLIRVDSTTCRVSSILSFNNITNNSGEVRVKSTSSEFSIDLNAGFQLQLSWERSGSSRVDSVYTSHRKL